jgi:hypothetical protein
LPAQNKKPTDHEPERPGRFEREVGKESGHDDDGKKTKEGA